MATGNLDFGLTTEDILTAGDGAETTVIQATDLTGHGGGVVVPGGTMMLTAEFTKEGSDLVVTGADGTTVVIQDYFSVAESPALETSGGAQLPADLVLKLAHARDPMQVAQDGGRELDQPIGTVDTTQGGIAIRADGVRVELEPGSPVHQGDVLETAPGGTIEITFIDDTAFTIGEEGWVVLDELVYDPGTNEGSSSFSVVQGVFSFVSGAIAKTGSDAMTVRTPVATIGICGTQVAVQAAAEGEENVITLLQEEGGITGKIVVSNSAGTQVLNEAFATTTIQSFFTAPSEPVILPEAQVNQMFGGAVAALQANIDGREARAEEARAEGEAEGEGEAEAEAEAEEVAEEAVFDDLGGVGGEEVAEAPVEVAETAADPGDVAIAEAVAEIAGAVAAAAGEDPGAAADAAFEAAIAGVAIDALVETAAGGEGFGGVDGPDPAAYVGQFSRAGDSDFGNVSAGTYGPVIGGFGTGGGLGDLARVAAAPEPVFAAAASVIDVAPDLPPPDLDASAPDVSIRDAGGAEDTKIPLEISAAVTDLDGSESITDVTIAGVPDGAVLSASTNNGDGTWSLSPDQLEGLAITPQANSDDDFMVTVTGTATEADRDSATAIASLDVTVTSVADAPDIALADVVGDEDSTIALDIGVALTDVDGSESITNITISGVPAGATLSAGTDNGDGTWTLLPDNLPGLTINLPADSADDFTLTVSATSTDTDGDSAVTVSTLDVTVTGVADVPTVTIADAAGAEDSAIQLDIGVALNDIDGSETITDIKVSGVPTGTELSAGTDNGDGTWTLTTIDLAGLTVTPAPDSDADFTLSVSTTSTEAEGDAATTLDVTVTGVADQPTVTVADATGAEDTAIPLDIGAALTDVDGSETITDVTISGVPTGAELSAGTDNGDGIWTLTPADLAGLTVTQAPDSDADFTLSVSAMSTEADGDTATMISSLDVTVTGVADQPTVSVADATGAEDSSIALDITAALTVVDGSETITDVTISGVPAGAELSAGTDNGDGTWTLTPADLGGLTVTLTPDSDADFTLSVSATSIEADGGSATPVSSLDVTVTGVVD